MPKIAILLCTFDGQRYLADQLASIAAQSQANWTVWASDDGSRDATLEILQDHAAIWGHNKLSILRGPSAGFVRNFLALTCNAAVDGDFYAFADQDDIWDRDKLERAVASLGAIPSEVPALYCARTMLVDADNNVVGLSPLFTRPPSFRNALVQNIGSGNTMVFNQAARQLLIHAGAEADVFAHDWWAYLLVTGCGGILTYDPVPSVRYRQHQSNQIGLNTGLSATVSRLGSMLKGRYRTWNGKHVLALSRMSQRLTEDHRQVLDRFAQARSQSLLRRLANFWRSGIYRQTAKGNAGLVAAAVLNKI